MVPANVTETNFSRLLDDVVRMYCAVAVDAESETDKVIGFATCYPLRSANTVEELVYLHACSLILM